MGSSFGYENSHVLGGELVYEIFVRGSVYILRNVVRLLCIFFSFFYIYLMYTSPVTIWHTLYLSMDIYIYMLMYVIHLSFHVLFLFSLYAHASYYLYAIFYLCLTLRCPDEFCLKCFRNTGCQSLLAMNSLLAKLFKSLCYNRFYCIQQASMSWMIYELSHIFICLLWFCHWLLKGEIVKTYVNHVRNICQYRIG